MAQGGFKYAEVSLTLDKSIYTNVDQWCLAVHKARCEAFLKASQRWRDHYIPIQTNEPSEESAEINYDAENTCTVYYNPILTLSGNLPSSSYLAYSSFFKHPDTSFEYVIITSKDFGTGYYGTSSAVSKNLLSLPVNQTDSTGCLGYSQNHGCSPSGFDNYRLSKSTIGFIIPVGAYKVGANYTGAEGLVGSYTSISTGTTFRFGASVKDDIIFAFFFNFKSNNSPSWSVVGKIFSEDAVVSYGGLRCNLNLASTFEYRDQTSSTSYGFGHVVVATLRYDYKNMNYTNTGAGSKIVWGNLGICYSVSVTELTQLPDKIPFSAVYIYYSQDLSNTTLQLDKSDSLDNNGTLGVLVNPEVVAVTANNICKRFYNNTICNGNYIINNADSSNNRIGSYSGGFIIGWDPSNPPLI